jgi:ADP-ribose pyrophosphatase
MGDAGFRMSDYLRGAARRFRQRGGMQDRPTVVETATPFQGSVFSVRVDRLRYGDGQTHRIDVVEHPASLAIVATPSRDEIVLVRQYRHAANAFLWEVPAGSADRGESPEEAARRELREETGYSARRLRPLGAFFTSPGFCDELMHFYHAHGLEAGEQQLDEDERIDVATFSYEAAWRLVHDGQVADGKTVLALLWLESGRGEISVGFDR